MRFIKNKILFAGDPHNDFSVINETAIKNKPEAVIILGDLELKDKNLDEQMNPTLNHDIDVFWIPGNHDELKSRVYKSKKCVCLHGKVIKIGGLKIAGFGMPYGIKSKYEYYLKDYNLLKKQKSHILVSHDAPLNHDDRPLVITERYNGDSYSPKGNIQINKLAKNLGAFCIFHGHYRHPDQSYIKDNYIWSICVGHHGITNEFGLFIDDHSKEAFLNTLKVKSYSMVEFYSQCIEELPKESRPKIHCKLQVPWSDYKKRNRAMSYAKSLLINRYHKRIKKQLINISNIRTL